MREKPNTLRTSASATSCLSRNRHVMKVSLARDWTLLRKGNPLPAEKPGPESGEVRGEERSPGRCRALVPGGAGRAVPLLPPAPARHGTARQGTAELVGFPVLLCPDPAPSLCPWSSGGSRGRKGS